MRQLEQRFPDELVVIGIEAGKYQAERVTANIRQAALRLGADHPIANDHHFRTWRAYAVNAWPTLVVVDPAGYYVGAHAGEIDAVAFEPAIARVIAEADARGLMNRSRLDFLVPERAGQPHRPVSFPGQVLAISDGRLFVADSGHNRILVLEVSPDGRLSRTLDIAGNGEPALVDGGFDNASFRYPQGLALDGDTLYVADSANHAVRALDMRRRTVSTIAGTGQQARMFGGGGPAGQTSLSSPWDVAVAGDTVFVAMAGAHQIWRIDLGRGHTEPFAGSGREDIVDGPSGSAALAQPMALAVAGPWLYFADSESSAVRRVRLSNGSTVETLVGTGLFDYGDKDGVGDEVRLQHPQGLAWHDGFLYIADTYNNRLKRLDPAARRVVSLPHDIAADSPTTSQFYEPAGLSIARGKLYVADTNNHAIKVIDLSSGELITLALAC